MRMQRICKRCHHVRPVNGRGYCASCTGNLDGMEKRRRPSKEATEEPSATEQEPEELAEAPTDPAPAQEGPEDRKGEAAAPETRSESPPPEPFAVKP